MEPIESQTLIDAPRHEVFDFVADLANHPSFVDHFVSEFRLERLNSTGVGAAARFRIDGPLAVLSVWVELVLSCVEPPHRIRAHGSAGRSGRVPCEWVWELIEAPGGLTRVTVTTRTGAERLPDVLRERLGLTRSLERNMARALQRLRGRLEGEAEPAERVRSAGGDPLPTLSV